VAKPEQIPVEHVREALGMLGDFLHGLGDDLDSLAGKKPTPEQRDNFALVVSFAEQIVGDRETYGRMRRIGTVFHGVKDARNSKDRRLSIEYLPDNFRTPGALKLLAAAVAAPARLKPDAKGKVPASWRDLVLRACDLAGEVFPDGGPEHGKNLEIMIAKHERAERRVMGGDPRQPERAAPKRR
jgi:hypothetical protein